MRLLRWLLYRFIQFIFSLHISIFFWIVIERNFSSPTDPRKVLHSHILFFVILSLSPTHRLGFDITDFAVVAITKQRRVSARNLAIRVDTRVESGEGIAEREERGERGREMYLYGCQPIDSNCAVTIRRSFLFPSPLPQSPPLIENESESRSERGSYALSAHLWWNGPEMAKFKRKWHGFTMPPHLNLKPSEHGSHRNYSIQSIIDHQDTWKTSSTTSHIPYHVVASLLNLKIPGKISKTMDTVPSVELLASTGTSPGCPFLSIDCMWMWRDVLSGKAQLQQRHMNIREMECTRKRCERRVSLPGKS